MDQRLLWLALGGFANGLEGYLFGSLPPGISTDFGVTVGQAALVVFGFSLVQGFRNPKGAALLDLHLPLRRSLSR